LANRWRCQPCSGFLDEFRFQLHRAEAIDLAVDVVIAVDQTDVARLGADLHHQRRPLHFQILDHGDRVAVLQHIAHRIAHDLGNFRVRRSGRRRPFMAAFRADQLTGIFIGERALTVRAIWQLAHAVISTIKAAMAERR